MGPKPQNHPGNNGRRPPDGTVASSLQSALERRLTSYSRRTVTLPDTIGFGPVSTGSRGFRNYPASFLLNHIISFWEYLTGEKYAISQLTGYQGEMILPLPVRWLETSVLNLTVNAALRFSRQMLSEYLRMWQFEAPQLTTVTRIEQTGSLAYQPPEFGMIHRNSVTRMPASGRSHPEGALVNTLSRRFSAQDLSAISPILQLFESMYSLPNAGRWEIPLRVRNAGWRQDEPLPLPLVAAVSKSVSGQYREGTASHPSETRGAASGPLTAMIGLSRSPYPASMVIRDRLAEYIENRTSTAQMNLWYESFSHIISTAYRTISFLQPATVPGTGAVRQPGRYQSKGRQPPASATQSPDAVEQGPTQGARTVMSIQQTQHYSATTRQEVPQLPTSPSPAGITEGSPFAPVVFEPEGSVSFNRWPPMVLNLHHWVTRLDKSRDLPLSDRTDAGSLLLAFGARTRGETVKSFENGRRPDPTSGGVPSFRSKNGSLDDQQDTPEYFVSNLTFIRPAEQIRREQQEYTFTRTISEPAGAKFASQPMEQKEVVNVVRKEVETALKARSPMDNLTRGELTRLADKVYASLARRLVIEKERVNG